MLHCCRVCREAEKLGLEPLTKYNLQVLGSEQTYGPHADPYIAEVIIFFSGESFVVK